MSKNLKRLLIATVVILVGVVLYKSGTIEVNPLNLLTWFKDVGQGLWSLIPIREIISFIVGYVVALLVVYRKKWKKWQKNRGGDAHASPFFMVQVEANNLGN